MISVRAAAVRAAANPRSPQLLRTLASTTPDLPRITERRPGETGRGGKASDAGVKVAGACVFLFGTDPPCSHVLYFDCAVQFLAPPAFSGVMSVAIWVSCTRL